MSKSGKNSNKYNKYKTYNGRFDSPEEPQSGMRDILVGLALIPTWPCMFTIVVSIGLFIKGGSKAAERRMYRRFHELCAVIGMRDRVSVRELAKVSNMTRSDTMRYLQRMIARGYFGQGAYLDVNSEELVLSTSGAYQQTPPPRFGWHDLVMDVLSALRGRKIYTDRRDDDLHAADRVETEFVSARHSRPVELNRGQTADTQRADSPREKARPQTQTQAQAQPEPEQPRSASRPKKEQKVYMDELERILSELYELNEQIDDEAVSRRIDRIGTLTAGIFRAVIDNPQREQDVRKFMNYYLPTTLKLLKSYDMLEDQSFQGENIVASRKKIENVLDMLIAAFEKQLDRLFHNDALDIATDIDVLETMMAGDGLSGKGQMLGMH